jgi:hypothetical protein
MIFRVAIVAETPDNCINDKKSLKISIILRLVTTENTQKILALYNQYKNQ